MADAISEQFDTKEKCYQAMRDVRDLYNTRTTEPMAKAANKALHLLIVYCPPEIIGQVEATIMEFEFRMAHMGFDISYDAGVTS